MCSSSGGRAGIFSDVTPLQCCHGSQQELLLPANSILSSMDVCVCVYLQDGHLIAQLTLLFGGEAEFVDDFDGNVSAGLPVLTCVE